MIWLNKLVNSKYIIRMLNVCDRLNFSKIINRTFFFFLLVLPSLNYAQSLSDKEFIKRNSNTEKLLQLSEEFNTQNKRSLEIAEEKNIPLQITNSEGNIGYFSGVDEAGKPVYDFDDNENAAITSNINTIREGGATGLDLDGDNIEIGLWEAGGLVRLTHQEYVGRVSHGESASVTGHASHVSGTLIAAGIDASSRGMAPAATLVSRRSNDNESEMTAFAASGGMLSNHSYTTGDPTSNVEGYGKYILNSAEWDEIVFNAPYFTICKSAGNDRDDSDNTGDGGYDLVYSVGVSKNVITVGAVDDVLNYTDASSVVQSDFSNYGPTDDWRIKPDLVANGVSVRSCDDDGDTEYSNRSGTSMATPTTTGAIALLQQHYHNINGVYMTAATVKSLLINTTEEAGANDGPDFENGWGLLNAERAAQVISDNGASSLIMETSLNNNDVFFYPIEVDGTEPIALSIVWTDPKGSPAPSGVDESSLALINDLDVRIIGQGQEYTPWYMQPNMTTNNFTDAALKGDNFRDNVERIDVNSIPAGNYIVKVSHKGTLTNSIQNFSLVIRGVLTPTCADFTAYHNGTWSNGTPDNTKNAIVNQNFASDVLGSQSFCKLYITDNSTITIKEGDYMEILNDVTIDGFLVVEQGGSIVQVNNNAIVANNGAISVSQTTPLLQARDFILLSSPMTGETNGGVYSLADRVFSVIESNFVPNTDPGLGGAVANFIDDNGDYLDNLEVDNPGDATDASGTANVLNPGEGYLVFPQAVTAGGSLNYSHTYNQGTLNTGTITVPITYNGPATANNFNLLGNPYASAIDVSQFIMANSPVNEVYFWEHITLPDETLPGFGNVNFSMDDVSIRNLLGGTASANGGTAPGQFMPLGQGFAILAQQTEAGTNVLFNNDMRVTGNNGTVRGANQTNILSLVLSTGTYTVQSTALIGFLPEATAGIDTGYDSNRMNSSIAVFSTLESGEELAIQAREIFDSSMQIGVGFSTRIPEEEIYTLSLDTMEGIDMENGDIFLIDHLLNTVTDLKETVYSFTSSESLQTNRFSLVFEQSLLATDDSSFGESQISLYPNPTTEQLTVNSRQTDLQEVVVYDLSGRQVLELDIQDSQTQLLDVSALAAGTYFIRIRTNGDSFITKRFIKE